MRACLGDADYDLEWGEAQGGTRSPMDTPLWDAVASFVEQEEPGAQAVPLIVPGFTDSHWVRDAFGTVSYGFFPIRAMDAETAARLIHSADERVPVDDLELGVRFLRHAAAARAMRLAAGYPLFPMADKVSSRRDGAHERRARARADLVGGRDPNDEPYGEVRGRSRRARSRCRPPSCATRCCAARLASPRSSPCCLACARELPQARLPFERASVAASMAAGAVLLRLVRASRLNAVAQELVGACGGLRARAARAARRRARRLPRRRAHLDRHLRARRAARPGARAVRHAPRRAAARARRRSAT